jgi:hypothetical protein
LRLSKRPAKQGSDKPDAARTGRFWFDPVEPDRSIDMLIGVWRAGGQLRCACMTKRVTA